MYIVLLAFLLSLGLALALTPLMRRIALRIGCLDPVVHRSLHQEPKPYLGGVAMFVAFAVGVLAALPSLNRQLAGILICGGLVLLIGLVDDLRRPQGIRAGIKFLLQALAAALLVVAFDVRIDFVRVDWWRAAVGLPPGKPYLFLNGWAIPVSIFWLVAFTNVVNLVDGLDGLAAGISTIAALTLLIFAFQHGDLHTMVLTAALAGAAMGFLRYNFNPAKIFMGDAGSLFLGFTIGAIAIYGALKTPAAVGVAVPVLALGLPILDTAFAIVRRLRSGRSIGAPDKDHLHHRLLRLGLTHRSTVLVMWAISGWLGLSALAVSELAAPEALTIIVLVLVGCCYGAARMGLLDMPAGRQRTPEQ